MKQIIFWTGVIVMAPFVIVAAFFVLSAQMLGAMLK